MFRIFAPGLFGMVMMALWIYAIFDVIATDSILVRNLPKGMWVGLVVFFPLIGSIAWLTLGRPTYAGWRPGDTETRSSRPTMGQVSRSKYVAAEDRPDWQPRQITSSESARSDAAKERRLREWEADLERRERDLGDD